jgi:hypothetical protein
MPNSNASAVKSGGGGLGGGGLGIGGLGGGEGNEGGGEGGFFCHAPGGPDTASYVDG